jgi:hypothetical protein
MKNTSLLLFFLLPVCCHGQALVNSWIFNSNGQTASYWENTASGMAPPNYVYHTTTELADVLKVCYNADSVWVSSNGLTFNMGQYLNPGTCEAQDYVFRFPRNPTVPATKTISPKIGAIGALVNGIPIYGITNANSWDAASSSNMPGQGGDGIWNVEVYLSEGFVLDTAFGAHPQQQGAYHTHATPWRLYESFSTSEHSPIVGFAFDGYPIYGPYGYTDPIDTGSGISRMQSGYSLRNIATRHTLPDGTALSAAQYGPNVSNTYPLGMYCEDYEWLQSNGGDLDRYNGRFCVTPEYPSGTYAYFVTMDAAGTPEFPYYIGIYYYGAPDMQNFISGGQTGSSIQFPSNGTSCTTASISETAPSDLFSIYPNPVSDELVITRSEEWNTDYTYAITTMAGVRVTAGNSSGAITPVPVGSFPSGMYLVHISYGHQLLVQRIVVQ